MNQVIISGRLTRDPEVRYTNGQNGQIAVCKFTVAVPRDRENADFISCTAFGKAAENLGKYMTKGRKILVSGKLRQDRWESDGQTKVSISVIADIWEFGDKTEQTNSDTAKKTKKQNDYYVPQNLENDDDLPF